MLDPDVHLLSIAEKRDALRADDESQPLGKCAALAASGTTIRISIPILPQFVLPALNAAD